MSKNAWETYDAASTEFFNMYESLPFETVHAGLLPFLPKPGATCLDVGAGSGRDAAALADRGHEVIAVEPSDGLRRLAQEHHGNAHITWLSDSLPNLATVKSRAYRFDFVLVSAVWMHVHPEQRLLSLHNLKDLLTAQGRVALTLRLGAPNVERVMYPLTTSEVLDHALEVGLTPLYLSQEETDSLGRGDVRWQKIVLGRSEAT
jgi:2-polyprenyl-3-methyl-5-hydroxy-6-metoxy-1,4-benzoquinol methylase